MSFTKLPLAGNKLIISFQKEFGTAGDGKAANLFYSIVRYSDAIEISENFIAHTWGPLYL